MSISPREVEVWSDLLGRTARWVARDFPDVSSEDLYQEMWVFVMENHRTLDPEREGISTILNRYATKVAWAYRKEYLHWTSQYTYRPSDVKHILETSFFYSEWAGSYYPSDSSSRDTMAAVDVRADVMWAFQNLSENYQRVIMARYRDKNDTSSGSAKRKTLNRAIVRLTDLLNWYHRSEGYRGPGARRCITNATAAYIVENQEEK